MTESLTGKYYRKAFFLIFGHLLSVGVSVFDAKAILKEGSAPSPFLLASHCNVTSFQSWYFRTAWLTTSFFTSLNAVGQSQRFQVHLGIFGCQIS